MATSVRSSESELVRLAKLTVIRGIGLERARVLDEAGISDFRAVAKASKKRLAKLFPKVEGAELKRWKKQAKGILLEPAEVVVEERPVEERPVEEKPKPEPAEGVGGQGPEPGPVPTDDLAVIGGIGPARVRVLNESGISDFRTLARVSVIRLEKLFPGVAGGELLRWKKEARKGLARNRTAWLQRDRGDLAEG